MSSGPEDTDDVYSRVGIQIGIFQDDMLTFDGCSYIAAFQWLS
jgi:hypothetical protein